MSSSSRRRRCFLLRKTSILALSSEHLDKTSLLTGLQIFMLEQIRTFTLYFWQNPLAPWSSPPEQMDVHNWYYWFKKNMTDSNIWLQGRAGEGVCEPLQVCTPSIYTSLARSSSSADCCSTHTTVSWDTSSCGKLAFYQFFLSALQVFSPVAVRSRLLTEANSSVTF